ncbi:hypothetical protein BGZ57DRAFT_779192 [Hyaloscypha finlandica]|nr:hypothetical protein BGZ57DRAFT_779192 [Hyaloscypha finlandica]
MAGSDDEAKDTGRASFEAIEADWEDSTSVASAVSDPFSSASIEREALGLLETIRTHARGNKDIHRSRVLLAGHGFGGIVVKQAIIIANTTPRYYSVTLSIFKLVFFATPHRPDEKRGWEGIFLDMIKAPDAGFDGQLSQILSGLVNSVSQLSHVFHKFAGKYHITNFIETKGVSTRIFGNDVEHVVSCSGKDFNSILFCDINDLDQLGSLRTHFAPTYLWNQSIFISSLIFSSAKMS